MQPDEGFDGVGVFPATEHSGQHVSGFRSGARSQLVPGGFTESALYDVEVFGHFSLASVVHVVFQQIPPKLGVLSIGLNQVIDVFDRGRE